MNNIRQLQHKLNQQKNKCGLIGAKPAKVQEFDDAEHDFSAHITPHNWGIEVNLKTGYNPIHDIRQKIYARIKKMKDPLETLVLQLGAGHEVAHWELPFNSGKGCPYDTYNHDKILEAVEKALPQDKKQHTSYVANMFEDTMINPRVKEYLKDFSGQILFWDNQGLENKERKGFTPLYEAFVKINMHLFADKWDRVFLSRNYTNNPKVKKAVKEVIRKLNLPKNIQDTTPLFDKQRWPTMAKNYTKAIAELIDEIPKERMSAYEQKSGNGVEEEAKTEKGKREIAYGRYSNGEGQSPNIGSFEQLDGVYQKLAKNISVKVEAITRDSSMEISPLTYKPFDKEKHDPLKIKTSKFFIDENGFNFAYPDQKIKIDYIQKIQKKSFPDFKMVLVDDSGSMADGLNGGAGSAKFIPYGDNSKYHFALLGYYGIEKFLQEQGIAPYIDHGVTLFSDSTRFKKGNYNELAEIRKLLFNPNWSYTTLDAKVLKQAIDGEGNFILSISDGEIDNWASEKSEIKKIMKNNHYAHIQLGGSADNEQDKTTLCKNLEWWGIPVFYVNSGQDLSKLMVDVTKDAYRPFVQESKK